MKYEAQEYRGWSIVPEEFTQLGYRLGEGMKSRPGKGRKVKGWSLLNLKDGATKFAETLEAAKAYIDQYMGD